jgi:hypothetical protein
MVNLKIDGTQDTPAVVLDALKGIIELSGKSFPADVADFYSPILKWIDEYSAKPVEKTVITMKMHYFNTASSKVILDMLYKFEDISNDGKSVLIKWYYPDDDDDMKETGEEYEQIVDVTFEHIEYTA